MNRYKVNPEPLKIGSKVKLSYRFWLAYKLHSENDNIAKTCRGVIIGEEDGYDRWIVKWDSEDMESIAGLYIKKHLVMGYE